MGQEVELQTRGTVQVEVFDRNPFGEFEISRRRATVKTDECFIAEKHTGEVIGDVAGFWKFEDVDRAKFVKVYVKGLAAFEGVSTAGAKVFEILLRTLADRYGQDTVLIQENRNRAFAQEISRSTLRRGIQELIDRKFIARTPGRGLFWINPEYVFNGDRITFAKQYRLREQTKEADPRQTTVEGEIDRQIAEESSK